MNTNVRFLAVISSFMLLSGCLDSSLDFTPVDDDTEVKYDVSANFSGPNDPFEIIGISPDKDVLNLYLNYSGGCSIHEFRVIWDGEVRNAGEYQEVFLKVFHQGNNDECEAMLKTVVQVELNKVLGTFNPDEKTRLVVQNGSNGHTIRIDPVLATIIQSKNCQIKAAFENSLCGYGVWQNNWFKMADSLGTKNPIWLQPVSHNPEISSEIPASGNYKLGITLLFGYRTPHYADCMTIPEGQVVPVEINCISLIE